MGFLNTLLGIPELASEHGEMVDHMLELVHWFMLVLGVGWTIFFFYVLFFFRKGRNAKANYKGVQSHVSTHLEVGVILVEIVLLLGFAFPLWAMRARSHEFPTGPDVAKVRAVGQQFLWNFHYPGPDGKFGRIDFDLMSTDNAIGLDRDDPNAKDDFVTVNNLQLPRDRDCVIQVTSKDVIHGLAMIKLRAQQDAIPGMEIPMWFVPTKNIEDGEIICAQLCGTGHAVMIAYYSVVDPEAFDTWVKEQSPVKEAAAEVAAAE